jgi:RHS repeat-associated protein
MKAIRLLIFGFFATTFISSAQELRLQKTIADPDERAAAITTTQTARAGMAQPLFSQQNVPSTPIAEQITGNIQQLARDLENDPVRIYNYVHDHIRHELYFGSKKGAALTLLEKSGNEFDQCALLVALLRSAGYTNCGYQFGWMELPYDSTDHRDLKHWLQLTLTNSNWTTTSNYLDSLIRVYRGYPATAAIWGTNTFGFQRIWVTLTNGGNVYYLDPAFKVHEPISSVINLQTATGVSSNGLMTAAGGTDTGNYTTNLSEAVVRSTLAGYTTNLLNYIQNNSPNASVAQIIGGWQIVPSTNTTLSTSLPFTTYEWGGQMPLLTWANEPTNLMSIFSVSFAGTNFTRFMPELEGQRLVLTYDSDGFGQLWLEDTDVADNYDSAGTVVVSVNHPFGYWDTNSNNFVDTTAYDQSVTNTWNVFASFTDPPYFNAYNIVYAFEPDWGWLQQREDFLDYIRSLGFDDFSFDVQLETMNVMGLQYALQMSSMEQMVGSQSGILPQNHHFIGRVGQEPGQSGYYFDFFMWQVGDISAGGVDAGNSNTLARAEGSINYFGSALEHGVIEQLQNSNYVAASTVKMLELGVTNGDAIYLASSTNWQTGFNVKTNLVNYRTADLTTLTALINAGDFLLLPRNGNRLINGPGSWGGFGYVDHDKPGSDGMVVDGLFGGQISDLNATVNPRYVSSAAHGQPRRRPFGVSATGADPVDTASGGFQMNHTDLSVGKSEPRGITLGTYYNSVLRYQNPAGMAPGWVNNYYANAQVIPAPQAGLGRTTPAQAAPMIAAACASLGLYNGSQPDPKNWTVTALIAKWAIDQLNQKGVSVVMGKDTLQFVQQPDGSFTAPANCTWTLTKSSGYVLQERHGNTFQFDSGGRLTNIVDQYSQPLSLTYNSSNWVQTVTDWKGRSLTFNYTGTPSRLTSVTDNAGSRTIKYGYGTNGDLTSFTDPENKTNSYVYDGDHEILATRDALGQLVTTNIYDPYGFGRVNTQYAQGNTSKAWQVYWSGWQTVIKDPTGGKQSFFYDDKSRLIGFQDALGNLSQTLFDGQDHLVTAISPLNETNRYVYDGNHNLTLSIDPQGFTNQFIYDNQNNLTQLVDARGNPDKFGYNAQFSLTGITNGVGDWVSLVYNSDGTLHTRTDPGGTTTYGYDSYGQLNSITHPGSLGSESFANSAMGDVTSHTNPRGFATTYQYNLRRQLTNSIAPTNLTASLSYDSAGNLQTIKDPRGFSTTETWSPTRRLLATTLPTTAQGTPMVTNIFDNRDWLTRTLDPLQQPTLFTNDLAGRLISVTDPLLRTTILAHDNDGRKTAITNAALEVNFRQWNSVGELTKEVDNASHNVLRSYDGNANQTILTNRNGKKWQFQFDAANRLTNTITPQSRQFQQVWNNRGLLQSITEPSTLNATFYYDAKARLTNRTDNVGTTIFQYDANNNATNVFENGKTNGWSLDAYDRVASFTDADGNKIQYQYDANGNLTNLVYPGNRTVSYSYDSLNRMTNVTDWANRKTTITYDLASRIQSVTRPNGTTRTINYDSAGEITNIIEQSASKAPIAFFKLSYNNAARAQWEFAGPTPHSYTLPSRSMTFDDDNRILTLNGQNVTNDADGNMTWGPLTNSTFSAYAYDARNRLLSAGGLSYAYGPTGIRTAVTNGATVTKFVVDPNATLPRVLMRVRNGVTNYYVYGPGLLYEVTETAATTSTLTYHSDLRGSTVALTDANGNVTDRIEYSAYGAITYRAGTNDTPFLFNGRYGVQTDLNGLLYMQARYYNPYICRFINPDPAGFAGGLNWYAYADGNPVSMIDPFGLGAEEGWGGATATWINRHLVHPLNSVSTTSTTVNFAAYMASSIVGGLGDLLRLARIVTRDRSRITWVQGSAENLPVPEHSATVVWSVATVHHWADVTAGLAEVRRVLSPGGRFLVIERQVRPGATGLASHGWTDQQAATFAECCRSAGLDDVRVETLNRGRRAVQVVKARRR